MEKLLLLPLLFYSFSLSAIELTELNGVDNSLMAESRGMANLAQQSNITGQNGIVSGNDMSNAQVVTGANVISGNSFSNTNGIIMVNLSSGNNNITNMSTSINIISVK